MSSSNQQQAPEKKSRGRQKMKMQKIENKNNLKVTFSKRRPGIFKKASELCVRCAAEVLIIIFSPGGRAYSYGHPGVEQIMNRFLDGDAPDPTPTNANIHQMVMEATRNYGIRTRNLELTQLRNLLDMERKRGEELDAAMKKGQNEGWIPPPFEDFDVEQLKYFDNIVSNFQKHFGEKVAKFKSLNLDPTPTGFNETNELYATGDTNVTSDIGSSVFDANYNQINSFGSNNVAAGFNNNRNENYFGELTVPFTPEISNWASGFSGETRIANNVVPDQNEFNNLPPGFGNTGAFGSGQTNIANNVSAPVSVPTEFTDWIPGLDNIGVSNTCGAVSVEAEFDNWGSGFNDTGGFVTRGTSSVNNGGAVSVPNEFNGTGETSNVGVQYIYDSIGLSPFPDDLFTAPYDPKAPGIVSDTFSLMTDNPSNDIFPRGSVFPGFNDGGGPSQL